MNLLEAILLGIVQGVTEWLPVSSSAHLALLQNLLGMQQPVIFDLILHMGSLAVVLFVFRKDIFQLITGVLKRDKASLSYLLQMVIASVPIALVGFLLHDLVKPILGSPITIGFSLLFTSILLFLSKYPRVKDKSLTYKNTMVIGIFQAIAILPGVSRSGSTISAGLMQGVSSREAAKFSFLIFVPAILGATLFELKDISMVQDIPALAIGTVAAAIAGLASLKLLFYIIEKGRLHYFGWYCLSLGLFVLGINYFA